jgi:hypothetical protein
MGVVAIQLLERRVSVMTSELHHYPVVTLTHKTVSRAISIVS